MTERKDASRCNTAACAFLRVIQDHVQNGGLVGDVAVGVGGVTLKSDAFARLNDNGLLIGRDFDCTGEKGYKLDDTPQMWLRFPMAAGSQLHIVDGELPVFIVRKKAVVFLPCRHPPRWAASPLCAPLHRAPWGKRSVR